MKTGYTHVCLILDRTGSMSKVVAETISGVNMFIKDQRKEKGLMTMTLVQFDSQGPFEVVADFQNIKKIKLLNAETYVPRGMTPLWDAIGMGIDDTGKKLAAMKEEDRPDKVIFAIMTDGEENASHVYIQPGQIQAMVQHQTDVYKWKFTFLGANMDAIQTAAQLGISQGNALTYAHSAQGTQCAFAAFSKGTRSMRSAPNAAVAASLNYYQVGDRQTQEALLKQTKPIDHHSNIKA